MSKTYEQRVYEYAQRHADDFNFNEGFEKDRYDSDEFFNEGKITCSAVADELKQFMTGHMEDNDPETIEQYLIENGYVPKP